MLVRVTRLALLSFVAAATLGCGQPQAPVTVAGSTPSSTPKSAPSLEPTRASAAPEDAGPPPDAAPPPDPSAEPEASAKPEAPPPPVERTGKTWPFHAWDHAEALTFNQFEMQPGAQLYAYDEHGWSKHIVDRKPLDAARAKKAASLVAQTKGGVDVSKCPFPRHAVILYDHEIPVASINVCFSCGDILIWPSWETGPEPDWEHMTDKQWKSLELKNAAQMRLYKSVFPKWQAFFRDEVGFSIDARYH
jgi:hypothetical protein